MSININDFFVTGRKTLIDYSYKITHSEKQDHLVFFILFNDNSLNFCIVCLSWMRNKQNHQSVLSGVVHIFFSWSHAEEEGL